MGDVVQFPRKARVARRVTLPLSEKADAALAWLREDLTGDVSETDVTNRALILYQYWRQHDMAVFSEDRKWVTPVGETDPAGAQTKGPAAYSPVRGAASRLPSRVLAALRRRK